jgi:hypothetical protein
MTKPLQEIRDELAQEQAENSHNAFYAFKRGWDAALHELSKRAGEFDEQAFDKAFHATHKECARLREALEEMLKQDNGGDFSWQELAKKALAGE